MIIVRPGHSLKEVRDHLDAAKSSLANVQNKNLPQERASAYFGWGGETQRTLGSAVSEADMRRLVLTPTYWHLLPLSPQDFYGDRSKLLDIEIQNRLDDLGQAREEVDAAIWQMTSDGDCTIAVLDTNVFMNHPSDLTDLQWHQIVGERDMRLVRVVIPVRVVDELDKLKLSRGEMIFPTGRVQIRSQARAALRSLREMFSDPAYPYEIDQAPEGSRLTRVVRFELLTDAIDHIQLEDGDSEIRDRALSLVPFAARTILVTFDQGNAFAAQAVKLGVRLLIDEEDQADA